MWIGNPDFGVSAIAGLARELKRDDTGDIALERQDLQVEHQARVVGVSGWHSHGAIQIRQRIVLRVGLSLLNAALPEALSVGSMPLIAYFIMVSGLFEYFGPRSGIPL